MNARVLKHRAVAVSLLPLVFACSGSDEGSDGLGQGGAITAVGGQTGIGGATAAVGGATAAVGGMTQAGTTVPSVGGSTLTAGSTTAAVGGETGVGGSVAVGGTTAATGGTKATGGTTAKGGTSSTGGTTAKGGTSSTGGTTAKGGTSSTGGTTAKGGTSSTGGMTGACTPDWGTTPSNVSAWINESWDAQLGNNVRGRKAWLLDSVMKGKGQINLCVRWGATVEPSDAVKANMASSVQKWFNDWFSQLAGYGCFPYSTITAKVTGWAVKPGNESWVNDLGSDVKVYTEVDGSGEPKCPDACSFFEQANWGHTFPNCPGGEAYHTDYWLWLDNSIEGGAAAVGGDWGLRMPRQNFENAMGKSNLVIEHEMGHGFGFQDYYDWTGSRPTGGSLMIVSPGPGQSTPTTADMWLLRRTWKEMKTLRGW
jgi:hypothetical protein